MNSLSLVSGALISCIVLCQPASAVDLKKYFPLPKPEAVKAQLEQQTAQPATVADAADLACPKSGATGELSALQTAKAAVTKMALNAVAKNLQLEEVQMPQSIQDVCQAQKRLTYVQRSTSRWSVNVINAIEQAKEALEIKQEADSYRAFLANPDFGATSEKDITRLRKDMKNDLDKIHAAIQEKQTINQAKVLEARTNMRAAMIHGGLIGAWDKRLVEFISDNPAWAFNAQNMKSVLLFKEHLGLLAPTLQSVAKVNQVQMTASATAQDQKKADTLLKEREKENQAFEKQLNAELKL